MATPTIDSVVTSSETSSTTTHTVDLPTGHAVGDWIVVAFAKLGHNHITLGHSTLPAGWAYDWIGTTEFERGVILTHEVNGLEDWYGSGTPTITVTTPSGVISVHTAMLCTAGGVFVEVGDQATSTTTADPPAAQALWLDNETSVGVVSIAGFRAQDGATYSVSAYPSGYNDDQTFTIDDNGSTWLAVGIAADDVTATGDVNPGTFTLSATMDGTTGFTILLFPAADYQTWPFPGTDLVDVSVQIAVTEGIMVGYPVRWVDVTSDVKEFSWRRGRQHELDAVETGTADLLLDNNDGDWTPTNTAGAYYPYINPMLPIRITARSNSVTYFLFTGYLERLPLVWPGRQDTRVQATAVDALKVFGLRSLFDRETAVEALAPVAWWRMTDAATADSSSAADKTLTWNGSPATGLAGVWSGDEAISLDGSDDYATAANEGDVELLQDMTIEAWVKVSGSGTVNNIINANVTSGTYNPIYNLYYDDTITSFRFQPTVNNFGVLAILSGAVQPDTWYHLVVTIDWVGGTRAIKAYVNGTLDAQTTAAYQPGAATRAVNIGRAVFTTDSFYSGNISEIAIYDSVLTAVDVANLYAAQRDPWQVQLTSARIDGALDDVGWIPRSVRAGQTSMQVAPTAGVVRDEFDRATTTEAGVLFVNGQGVVVFHDRHYRILEQGTSGATFTDSDGGGFHYADLVVGTDENQLWTEVAVTPGTVDNTTDTAARTAVARSTNTTLYDIRTLALTTYPDDRDDGLRMANYLVAQYDTPTQQIERIAVNLGYTQTEVTALLAAEIGNRYTVARTLPGDDFSADMHLEAVEHTVTPGQGWRVGWWLSPATSQQFWILGTSELGTDTRLAF